MDFHGIFFRYTPQTKDGVYREQEFMMAQQFMITLVLAGITYSLILQALERCVPEADIMEVHATCLELPRPGLLNVFSVRLTIVKTKEYHTVVSCI